MLPSKLSQPRMLNIQVPAVPSSPRRVLKPCKLHTTLTHDSSPINLFFHAVYLPCLSKYTAVMQMKLPLPCHETLQPLISNVSNLNTWSLTYWSKIPFPFPLYPLLVTPTASDLIQTLCLSCQEYCSNLSLLMGHQASIMILLKH